MMAYCFGHYFLAFAGQPDGFAAVVAVAAAGLTFLAGMMCAECPGHYT